MKFTKMHGIGNDYIYINTFAENIKNPSELAIRLSDRHFGIGSDGLILIGPSSVADVRMRMYNSDGSESAMCGNGIRCVGKYAFDNGLCTRDIITVETGAGIKTLNLNIENGKVNKVRVDMGEPELKPKLIPLAGHDSEENFIAREISVNGRNWKITAVSMGNPHAVVFLDKGEELSGLDLEKIGPKFENHELFPQRVNTEFVQAADKNNLYMRVWERGSGETLACGTGACAVAVAGFLNNLCERKVCIHLLRGLLDIEWAENNHVFMTGEAVTVFTGEICL